MPRTKLQTPNFSLSKRDDGYYIIRYTENGKTKNKATSTKDATEAEAQRARFAASYIKPKLAQAPTVTETCEAYVKARKPVIASGATLEYNSAPLKRLIGSIYISDVTQTVVNGYIQKRAQERPQRSARSRYKDQPVSEATINKELRTLRAAMNWAYAEGLIDKKPGFRIELTSGGIRDEWLTKEQAAALFDACSPHLALFLRIALSTAKRREAILSLKWEDVDLSRPGHEVIDFGADVGNKRKGKTPIAGNRKLIDALKAAKEIAKTEYVIEFRGERIKDVKTALSAACRRAGVPNVSAHTLKHTAVTWMVQSGMTYEEIAKTTHTTKEVIERVYGHHSNEFVRKAMDAVAF